MGACWDSWCPDSPLRINGHTASGGVMVLDEFAQTCEHLLLSNGTALGKGRRAASLRTLAEQVRLLLQILANDAQLPAWAVRLLGLGATLAVVWLVNRVAREALQKGVD